MFELTKHEFDNLRSQIVTSSWGGTRYSPMAFTEQGVETHTWAFCTFLRLNERSIHE